MNPSLVNVSPRRAARVVSRKRAFTLIELLTVIAIIGILATILIPVVGKVRRSASSAQCASHMRQIGTAVQMYAQDNRGHLPAPGPGGSNLEDFHTGQGPWFNREQQRLQNHIGTYLHSPKATTWSTSTMDYDPHFAWSAFLAQSQPGAASILLNRKVRVRGSTTEISPWKRLTSTTYRGQAVEHIDDPSRQVAFTEVDQKNTNAAWKSKCPPEPIHGAYRNALFFDWHVEKVPANG